MNRAAFERMMTHAVWIQRPRDRIKPIEPTTCVTRNGQSGSLKGQ